MKKFLNLVNKYVKYYIILLAIILLIFAILFSFFRFRKDQSYFLFIEFNNAYGLKIGTSVNYRGVKIGYISKINICLNKVIILIKIKNIDIMLPKESLFEVNQIGLFNDRAINISPLKNHFIRTFKDLSQYIDSSYYITPNSYIKGYKGVNYDDLIRSTTRIAQRFDDPRFFSLFYLLLYNSIEFSDNLLLIMNNLSTFLVPFFYFIYINVVSLYI